MQLSMPSPLVSASTSNPNHSRILLALQPHLTHKLGESCMGFWMQDTHRSALVPGTCLTV